jgi:hypothetical protein
VDCICRGYHFKHRRGGGMCYYNEDSWIKHAARAGTPEAELLDVLVDIAWDTGGKRAVECPF